MAVSGAVIRYADRHLQPYRVNADGTEIIPQYCPFCGGGEHHDRDTFALNVETGLYVCKRGTCGARGRIDSMAEFGQIGTSPLGGFMGSAKGGKTYALPTLVPEPLTPEIVAYFEKRRISGATLDTYRVGSDGNGNIIFPFYRDGTMVYAKLRKPRKPQGNEPKEWQTPGACPILFGMDLCGFSKPLIITEGEIDALALAEAGAENVVSVPCGCSNLDWINTCWDWLGHFTEIILFGDSDPPGRKMVHDVARRLDESRCYVIEAYPTCEDGRICKDANEILYFLGADKLLETLQSAQPIPIKGVIQLADVIPYDPTAIPRIQTMIPKLDTILGGLMEGG